MSDNRFTVWCCVNGTVEPHAARNTGDPMLVELIRRGRFKTVVRVGDPDGVWFCERADAVSRGIQILEQERTFHAQAVGEINEKLFRLRNGI